MLQCEKNLGSETCRRNGPTHRNRSLLGILLLWVLLVSTGKATIPTSGLKLWLDANLGVTLSGSGGVSAWQDQSGNGNNAVQSASGNQPTVAASAINGLPAIQFTASSNQYFNLPNLLSGATAGEVFVVIKATSAAPSSGRGLWSFGALRSGAYPNTNGQLSDAFGSTSNYTVGLTPSSVAQFSIFDVSSQSGQWTSRFDGLTLLNSTSNTIVFNSSPQLGTNGSAAFDGQIAEIIIYNSVLSSSDRTTVAQYLTTKYALPNIAVPANPTSLSATAISPTEVSLTWSDAPTLTGITYTIWRETGGGTYTAVAQVNNALSYVDSGLSAGTTYSYEISSATYAGSSPGYSSAVSATTLASGTDMPLTGMRLWLIGDSGIQATSGGSIIQWVDQSGNGYNAVQQTVANQPTVASGVLNGHSAVGFSAASNQYFYLPNLMSGATAGEVFVVVKAASATPSASRGLWSLGVSRSGAYPVTNGEIADGFGSTSAYTVGLAPPGVAQYNIFNVSAQAGLWTARLDGVTLLNNTANTVTFNSSPQLGSSGVSAFDGQIAELIVYNGVLTAAQRTAVGQYLESKYALPGISTPANPTSLSTAAVSPTEVSLAWSDSATMTGIVYTIWRETAGGSYTAIAQVNNALSFIDSGLSPGTTYSYEISSSTLAGSSPGFSRTSSVTTLSSGTDMPLTGMKLWLIGDSGIQATSSGNLIQWLDQSGNGNNANNQTSANEPTVVANALNGRPAVAFAATANQSLYLPNFMAGATAGEVFVVVKATSAVPSASRGLWSLGVVRSGAYPVSNGQISEGFGSTSAYTVGMPPSNIAQYNIFDVSAQAGQWAARLNGMTLLTSTTNSVGFNSSPQLGSNGSIPFDGQIAELIVYNSVLSASQRAAVGQYLTTKYAIPAIPVPANPTGLVASAISPTEVSLVWSDAPTTAGIVYTIWRQTGGGAYTAVAQTTNALSFVDSGLSAGTSYSYEISSNSLAGASPGSSAPANVTTLASGVDMPLSGMRLWLVGDSGVQATSSGNIIQWVDQSGNGNNANNQTPANEPTVAAGALNGRPAVGFAASASQCLYLPNFMSGASSGEVFVIIKATSATPSASRGLWSFGATRSGAYPSTNGQISDAFGSTAGYTVGLSPSTIAQYSLYDISAQSGQWTARLDGITLYNSPTNTVVFNSSPQLGYTGSLYFDGQIAELIVYNGILTAAQRAVVGQYLESKYALPGIAVPATPVGLTATALSPTEVSLTWADSPTISGITYTIWRETGGGGYTAIAQVNNALSYVDSGLTAGTSYSYEISSSTFAGSSPGYSAAAGVTTFTSGTDMPLTGMRLWLSADSGLQATSGGSVIQWLDRSGSGNNIGQLSVANEPTLVLNAINNLPAVGFAASNSQYFGMGNIMSGATGGEAFVVLKATSATPSASRGLWSLGAPRTGAYPSTSGQISDAFGSTASFTAGIPPSGVTQFSIFDVSAQSGQWTAYFDGLTLFNSATNSVSFYSSPQLGTTGTSYFDGQIAEVIVYGSVLTSAQREAVGEYLQAKYAVPGIPLPANPTATTATAVSPTEVSLTWEDAPIATGITYTIWRASGGGGFTQVAQVENRLSFIDSGLTAGTSYSYQVSSATFTGPSPGFSPVVGVTTPATGTDMPLTGIRLWLAADSGVQATSAGNVIQWVDQSGNWNSATQFTAANGPTVSTDALNGRPAIAFAANNSQYFILPNFMSGATAGEAFVVVSAASATPTANRSLWKMSNNGNYPDVNGAVSESFGSTTSYTLGPPSTASVVPFHLFDVSAQAGQWIARFDNQTLVNSSSNSVSFSTGPSLGSNGSQHFDGKIAEVIVFNSVLTNAQRVAVSNYLTGKYLPDSTLQNFCFDLEAEAISTTQVNLTWVGDPTVTSYSIQRSVDGGTWVSIASVSSSATSYSDTSVPSGNVIKYEIQATDFAGALSPWSAPALAFPNPNGIDPVDGLPYGFDEMFGIDPTAGSDAIPVAPVSPTPTPTPTESPTINTAPIVILLTPSQATLH